MDETTAAEAAKTLEIAFGWQKDKDIPSVQAAIYAASILRRVASGELAPVIHAHWKKDGDIQICSNCGEEHEWLDYRATYCDSCGALMDGKDDKDAK